MSKRLYFLTLFFVVVAVGNKMSPKGNSLSEQASVNNERYPMLASMQAEEQQEMTEEQSETKRTSITSTEIKNLESSFPDADLVEEELKENPHTPSKTLMSFATRLGPLMEKAFANSADAEMLAQKLSECALEDSLAAAAKAMCVRNTERLAEVHTDVEKTAKNLRSSVSPEVQKLLDTNESFLKKDSKSL